MFRYATNFTGGYPSLEGNQPIGNWNVSNVTNMEGMFWNAENFTEEYPSFEGNEKNYSPFPNT